MQPLYLWVMEGIMDYVPAVDQCTEVCILQFAPVSSSQMTSSVWLISCMSKWNIMKVWDGPYSCVSMAGTRFRVLSEMKLKLSFLIL